MQYLRHDVRTAPAFSEPAKSLRYVTYAECPVPVFHRALLETYKGSLDCPEVNGIRSISEIIAGHQAQGTHEPDRWFLALNDEQPAGVLLLTEIPESASMEISYLGVLPRLRRRGIGRQLVMKAIADACAAQVAQLTLSVDVRNRPAQNLYRAAGFEVCGEREVYLALWASRQSEM